MTTRYVHRYFGSSGIGMSLTVAIPQAEQRKQRQKDTLRASPRRGRRMATHWKRQGRGR